MPQLGALLRVRPHEAARVRRMVALSAALGLAIVSTQTAAFALFLDRWGPDRLPGAYLATGIGAAAIAFGYLKLGERLAFPTLLVLNVSVLTAVSVGVRLGVAWDGHGWIVFGLPLWFQLLTNQALMAFWALANSLFDVRQGKRLFGVLAAGQAMAVALGGLLTPFVVDRIGTENLLWIAVGGLAVACALLVRVTVVDLGAGRPTPHLRKRSAVPRATRTVREPLRAMLAERSVAVVIAFVSAWWLAFALVDNLFLGRASVRFDDPDRLASFLGVFFAVVGVVGLATTLFVTGRVVDRFGLRGGLATTPALVLVATAVFVIVAAAGGAVGTAGSVLLVAAAAARFTHLAVGLNLDQPAHSLLYKPLPIYRVGRTAALAEGIAQPLAIAAAAGVLALATNVFAVEPWGLGLVALAGAALWLVASLVASGTYPRALAGALTRRQLADVRTPFVDGTSRALLVRACHDPHPIAAVWALEQLAALDPEAVGGLADDLLAHPAPEVRRRVLALLEAQAADGSGRPLPPIRWTLDGEPVAEVREAGLRALVAGAAPDAAERARRALVRPDRALRRGAIVALGRYGDADDRSAALASALAWLGSAVPGDRVAAAEALADLGPAAGSAAIATLVADADGAVARAALAAVGPSCPELWPAVVECCAQRDRAPTARAALARGGPPASESLTAALAATPADQVDRLLALVSACAAVDDDRTAAALIPVLDHEDARLRHETLSALATGGAPLRLAEPDVDRLLEAELAEIKRLHDALVDLGDGGPVVLVVDGLRERRHAAVDRVVLVAALAPGAAATPILAARGDLRRPSARPVALEVIGHALPARWANQVVPTLDHLDGGAMGRPAPGARAARLWSLCDPTDPLRPDDWTRACARHALAHLDAPVPVEASALVEASVPVEASVAVARRPTAPAMGEEDDPAMMSTIERVLVLKRVELLAEVPDGVLAAVAERLDEVSLPAETTIFEAGDLGESLYVVVRGEVRVHDGGRELDRVGEGEVFGEMAMLDPEPRAASVTTVEPTDLLRLDREPFLELLEEHVPVAVGVLRILTRRLRARMAELTRLGPQGAGPPPLDKDGPPVR